MDFNRTIKALKMLIGLDPTNESLCKEYSKAIELLRTIEIESTKNEQSKTVKSIRDAYIHLGDLSVAVRDNRHIHYENGKPSFFYRLDFDSEEAREIFAQSCENLVEFVNNH